MDVFIGFLALLGLSGFLAVRMKVPSSCAPLVSLSLISLVLLVGGLCGALQSTLYICYVVCFVLGGYAMVNSLRIAYANKTHKQAFHWCCQNRSIATLVFWGASLFFLVYFAWLKPVFTSFDEFSFWGTAAKQTVLFGRLYAECPVGTPWQATEFTALPLLSYFFQGFGVFTHWKALFSVNILLLAGLCAVAGVISPRASAWRFAVPTVVIVLLAPSFFTIYSHTATVSGVWLSFLGDLPAGVLFGGAVACWLILRETSAKQQWWILPVLCLAGNIKNNTFVLALAAAGMIAVDIVLFASQKQAMKHFHQRIVAQFGFAGMCLALPMVQYYCWSVYAAAMVAQKNNAGGYGATSDSLSAVLKNGLSMLFGLPVAPYYEERRADFYAYAQSMWQLFSSEKIAMLGTGATVVALILALFLGSFFLMKNTRNRLRITCFALCSTLCFALYWLMLLLSYAFILKDSSPAAPASYARYFGSYYLGWFLIALSVFVWACTQIVSQKKFLLAHGALLLLAIFVSGQSYAMIEPQFSVLQINAGQFTKAREDNAVAQEVQKIVAPDETVFFVHQEDDGYAWFFYSQALLPVLLEYGTGGGAYGVQEDTEQARYVHVLSSEEFLARVQESGASYLFIAQNDALFTQSYQSLFDDALVSAAHEPALYRTTQTGFVQVKLDGGESA